jgi:hypothetical protein
MQDAKSIPEQTNRGTAGKSSTWRRTVIAIVITALIAGTSGYLLGIRTNQNPPQRIQKVSFQPSPYQTAITQVSPTIAQPSNPRQSTKNYPVPTRFNPPASWRVYKSEYGYQYSYPPTWHHYPEFNAPSSAYAPDAKYPDGRFMVERLPTPSLCGESRVRFLLEQNPSMNQKEIAISGYPAFQLEGKSRLDDGYYDRKSVFVVRDNTCYYLSTISRNNPGQLAILDQILSTFKFYDLQTEIIKLRQKLESLGVTKEELDSLLYEERRLKSKIQ